MSRWMDKDESGKYRFEIASMDECQWLVNEVCVNDKSDQCCDFPDTDEYCKKHCPHFTKETGLLKSN